MKCRLVGICLLGVLLCACGASTSYSSRKKVTQGIDYSHYGQNEAYYEFSSSLPLQEGSNPFVDRLTTAEQSASSTEEILGEAEDFISENLTSSYHTYGDVVVTVASRKFELGKAATSRDMATLMKSVNTGYAKALRAYQPSGFTYSVSSVGAINPLSDVQVQCRMSERSANDSGQKACALFFNTIRTTYLNLKEARS